MHAGSLPLKIRDETQGVSFPALVLYPTDVPSVPTAFGPYIMDVGPDAPVADGRFPIVVVSHGNGGSHLAHRTIALHLARNGHVVALVEHPGNNRNDNALAGTHENLANRPRHIRLAIDAIAADPRLGNHAQADNVAVVGHSLGGYTALAAAGGQPLSETGQPVEVVADRRIRSLVLLAPATAWFPAGDSLRHVDVPILMLVAEHDPYTPRWHADFVLAGVPDRNRVDFRVVANAGHFSFLSPFPASMNGAAFLPSTDPAGFDREAFHAWLPGEVLRHLGTTLDRPAASSGTPGASSPSPEALACPRA